MAIIRKRGVNTEGGRLSKIINDDNNDSTAVSIVATELKRKDTFHHRWRQLKSIDRCSLALLICSLFLACISGFSLFKERQESYGHILQVDSHNEPENKVRKNGIDDKMYKNKIEKGNDKDIEMKGNTAEKIEAHNDATLRMLQQNSDFVDGEKKLKLALKKVMERQRNNEDIGIKVASRWEVGKPVVFPGEKHVN